MLCCLRYLLRYEHIIVALLILCSTAVVALGCTTLHNAALFVSLRFALVRYVALMLSICNIAAICTIVALFVKMLGAA